MATSACRNTAPRLAQCFRVHALPSKHQIALAGHRGQGSASVRSRRTTPGRCTQAARFSTSTRNQHAAPKTQDRGPKSDEDTQTDFAAMNILSNTPVPTTAIDACMHDGFALNSGLKVTGSGVMLIGGEAFRWRPWIREGRKEGTVGAGAAGDDNKGIDGAGGRLLNGRGQLEVDAGAWGVLDLVWPKPDLLILGTGKSVVPLSPKTRGEINALGVRIEVQDTRNAAAQFNLLATERGVQQVAAALVPIGWREGR